MCIYCKNKDVTRELSVPINPAGDKVTICRDCLEMMLSLIDDNDKKINAEKMRMLHSK